MIECKIGYDITSNTWVMMLFEDQNDGPRGRRVNYYTDQEGTLRGEVVDAGKPAKPFMRDFPPMILQALVAECAKHGYVLRNEETVGALTATKDALADAREVRNRLLRMVENGTT